MTIEEFLQLSGGEWLSQKTNHQVTFSRYESGKSNVVVETLSNESPEVVALCQEHDIDPSTSIGGTKTLWTGYLAGDTSERREETTIALLPDTEASGTPGAIGKVLCKLSLNNQSSHSSGTYSMGADEALTLSLDSEEVSTEERIWFASENLRIRSIIQRKFGDFSSASLSSDIRRMTAPPKDQPTPQQ